jgi:uncharacterized protein with PQ loop repeat
MRKYTARKKIVKKPENHRFVDKLIYLAAILEPLVTLPQVIVIFRDKSAQGVSISSWFGFQVLTAVWIWYGIVHKDKAIIIYQGLFFIFQGMVIVGGIMYGAKWW